MAWLSEMKAAMAAENENNRNGMAGSENGIKRRSAASIAMAIAPGTAYANNAARQHHGRGNKPANSAIISVIMAA